MENNQYSEIFKSIQTLCGTEPQLLTIVKESEENGIEYKVEIDQNKIHYLKEVDFRKIEFEFHFSTRKFTKNGQPVDAVKADIYSAAFRSAVNDVGKDLAQLYFK